MQVALAWLLHRAPNILLIPGTSSLAHLRENLAAAELALPDDAMKELGRRGALASRPGKSRGDYLAVAQDAALAHRIVERRDPLALFIGIGNL